MSFGGGTVDEIGGSGGSGPAKNVTHENKERKCS